MANLYNNVIQTRTKITSTEDFIRERRACIHFYDLDLIEHISLLYHIQLAEENEFGMFVNYKDMQWLKAKTQIYINKLLC